MLEGIEGAGKTTIIQLLKEHYENNGVDIITTREPGGVYSAEAIRKNIMDFPLDKKTELLLFLAARREHLTNKVLPLIEKGKIIICDRFIYSTIAYQGYGRGIEVDKIIDFNNFVLDGLQPDLIFYIDISIETSINRKSRMNDCDLNRLDKETIEFYKRVRSGYEAIYKSSNSIYRINGEESINEIVKKIVKIINKN